MPHSEHPDTVDHRTGSSSYAPPVVDESRDLELGAPDIVFGLLTMPLLLWVLMYAVSGAEQLVATRRARMRLYMILLAAEVLIVAGLWQVLA